MNRGLSLKETSRLLCIIGLFLLHNNSFAQCMNWNAVGDIDEHHFGIYEPSMVIADNGEKYCVINRHEAYVNRAIVKKYNGDTWEAIGAFPFSREMKLTLDNSGRPMLAYIYDDLHVYVKSFDGTDWNQLGDPISIGVASQPDIKISTSGTPYLLFKDNGIGGQACVKKFDGSNWIDVGSLGISGSAVSYNSLAIDNTSMPWVTFRDASGSAIVMKYSGSTWENIGATPVATNVTDPHIALNNSNEAFVIYRDETSGRAVVKRFNGGAWVMVGDPGTPLGRANGLAITFDLLYMPVISYSDDDSSGKNVVKKYNGSSWESIGNAEPITMWSKTHNIICDNIGVLHTLYSNSEVAVLQYTGTISGNKNVCVGVPTALISYSPGGVWTSLNTDRATIDATTGVLTGLTPGIDTISYFLGSCSALAVITVNASPVPITNGHPVCIGSTTSLRNSIAGGTWVSSNPAIATIDGSGHVGGIAYGTTTISYSAGACTAVYIQSVNVAGNAGSIIMNDSFCLLDHIYAFAPVLGGTWEYSGGVGTYNSFANPQFAQYASALGTYSLSYSYEGCTSTHSFNMHVPPPASIVGGVVDTVYVDSGSTVTVPFVFGGITYSYDNSIVTPSSDFSSNFYGVAPGSALVGYSASPDWCMPYETYYVVVQSPTPIAPITGTLNVCVGSNTALSDITAGPSWSSSNPAVATVGSSTGIVTGVSTGTARISYALSTGSNVTVIVTVDASPYAGTLSGPAILCPGSNTTLTTTLPGGTWSSTTPSVATVGTNGVVTGIAAGTSTISYTVTNSCGTTAATQIVTVNPAPSAGTITGTATVCTGVSTTLSNAAPGGSWSAVNTAVASVGSSTGIVTGIAAGTTIISYAVTNSCGTIAATKVVTVILSPAAGTITGTAVLCPAATTLLADAAGGGTWSSANTPVATINASGLVSGASAGTATISYTVSNSCGTVAATRVVTVSPLPNAGNIIGTATVCAGLTNTLGNDATGGTWLSGNTAVATIGSLTGMVTGIASGTSAISYVVSNSCGTAVATRVVTVSALPAAGSITGPSATCAGSSITLGNTTSGGTWSSANVAVATIGMTTGILTGVAPGNVNITYTVNNSCGSAQATRNITVKAPSAGTISGGTSVNVGATLPLTSTVPGGSWTVSNANASINASGIVTGLATGTVIVSYTVTNSCGTSVSTQSVNVIFSITNPITGNLQLCGGATSTLSNASAGGLWGSSNFAIASINSVGVVTGVFPGTATISYTLMGSTVTAIVTVYPLPAPITGAGSVCINASTTLANTAAGGTWSSSNTTIATANAATGAITGVAAGPATITYSLNTGCYKTMLMVVNPLPSAITGTLAVCPGGNTILTNATATGQSWVSSNTGIATIGSGSGLVAGVATGTTIITYTINTGCKATAVVTVGTLPAPVSGASSLCAGSVATFTDATTGGTWSSSTPTVATVNTSGLVSGIAAGVANITYSTGAGCIRTALLTVNVAPATISGNTTLCTGGTTALGNTSAGGAWTSGNATVASINAAGLVSGLSAGTSLISYTLGSGCARTTTVTVSSGSALVSGNPITCVGLTTLLASAIPGGTWSSGSGAIASVTSAGLVTGIAPGTGRISYLLGPGCLSVTVVTVNGSVPVITGATSVCVNSSVNVSIAAGGGAWSSSNPALVTINASGTVTGLAPGTATISYMLPNGCSRTMNITVKALPAAIAGNLGLCTGKTSVVTDVTPTGVSWTSGNPAVASIGAGSGVVTGVSAGTATITYLANSGCTATAVVTVATAPSVPAITGLSSVAIGHTISLANAMPAGIWSSSVPAKASVSASGLVTGIANGAVVISYTVTNGVCSISATKAITVTASRDAALSTGQQLLQLYPNPTTGSFTVQAMQAGLFTTYTIDGKLLQHTELSEGINILSLPKGVAAGVYMCRYTGADGSSTMVRLVYEP